MCRGARDSDSPLGNHKIGKGFLYTNKLADIDLAVLERIVTEAVARMRRNYETFDE